MDNPQVVPFDVFQIVLNAVNFYEKFKSMHGSQKRKLALEQIKMVIDGIYDYSAFERLGYNIISGSIIDGLVDIGKSPEILKVKKKTKKKTYLCVYN